MPNPENILSFGITGSVSPTTPLNRNPSFLLSHIEVQELLIEIAEEPRTKTYIQKALQPTDLSLEDLVETGLLKQAEELYRINLILFLQEDLKIITEVAGDLATDLAERYLAEGNAFYKIMRESTNPNNDIPELAFILIGCFSLDWDGLQITNELGFRTEAQPAASGDRFIAWAEERQPEDVRAVYWGSHNDYYPNCVLTSFGDHNALPRIAFPDLGWRMGRQVYNLGLSPNLERSLMQAFSPHLSNFTQQVGNTMLALSQGARTIERLTEALALEPEATRMLLDLLIDLDYVREDTKTNYHPIIPVLPRTDKALVDKALTLSGDILVDWLPAHIAELRGRLWELTPLKYGLSFKDVFSQVWHYLFGLTNRHLVEADLFADPYSRRYPGYIPAVWHPDVLPEETTF